MICVNELKALHGTCVTTTAAVAVASVKDEKSRRFGGKGDRNTCDVKASDLTLLWACLPGYTDIFSQSRWACWVRYISLSVGNLMR